MKLSRAQIALGGMLLVGLGALTVDRLLIGYGATGPASANAATVVAAVDRAAAAGATASVTVVAAAHEPPPSARSLTAGSALVRQLTALDRQRELNTDQVANVFDLTRLLPAQPSPAPDAKADAGPGDAAARPQLPPFAQAHRLEATLVADNRSWALVDGRTIRLGQKIKHGAVDFRLDEVREREAVFVSDHESAVLRISTGIGR